jgi:hypothetical protein
MTAWRNVDLAVEAMRRGAWRQSIEARPSPGASHRGRRQPIQRRRAARSDDVTVVALRGL